MRPPLNARNLLLSMDSANNNPVLSSMKIPLDSPISSQAYSQEEPEYLARYMVIKHSWRGKYRRILCISQTLLVTLDPSTLIVTNSYDVFSDFDSAVPVVAGKDDPSLHIAQEFIINVRTDGRGKFKAMKFSSRYLCI